MPRHIRPIRIEGNIAYVPLTKGYEAVIDAADVPLVEGFNWYAMIRRHAVYAGRKEPVNGKQRQILMHRTIMEEPDGLEVDHINGDGLDNRRSNLRDVSRSENARNRKLTARNTSGQCGVSWHGPTEKWQAYIYLGGKQKNLGYFDDLHDAIAARKSAEVGNGYTDRHGT